MNPIYSVEFDDETGVPIVGIREPRKSGFGYGRPRLATPEEIARLIALLVAQHQGAA